MLTPKVPVAQEGYPFIGVAAFATLLTAIYGQPLLSLLLFASTIFILYFFRDPERFIPAEADILVSPADGRVILVDEVEDKRYLEGRVRRVAIFMNVFNVHVNRMPAAGKVLRVDYQPGKFYAADSDKSSLHNESCAVTIKTKEDQRLVVVQIAGLIARRIVCWLQIDDQIARGARFGLIRFGSRVDLYLPLETEISVKVGDKLRAGESSLGRLP